ncbi:hypothetical protein HDV00_001547 [Rhizophlyctis rosea]|nr:hypothetical protein HDV00_001547 [Rhizophlyctis rosea]
MTNRAFLIAVLLAHLNTSTQGAVILTGTRYEAHPKCRCLPKDPCWPSDSVWSHFNSTISGALIQGLPTASVCHDPTYNEAACNVVKSQWNNTFWRGDQPAAMMDPSSESINGTTCSPYTNRTEPCPQGLIPTYIVNGTSPAIISKAVKFASLYNLRLVVKNTGHEFSGRSTAPGALSVWVHKLKDINFVDNFTPDGCDGEHGEKAVTVGAGVQWQELFKAADLKNLTVVGGQNPTVGAAGGYLQGGGHSALGPWKGMTSDHALQFKIVTANGHHVTANGCQNQDLFWALRGGGGGTWGIVTSVTFRTFPTPSQVVALLSITTTSTATANADFNDFLGGLVAEFPKLSDHGWAGYLYYTGNNTVFALLNQANGDFLKSNQSLSYFTQFNQTHPNSSVIVQPQIFPVSSFYSYFNLSFPENSNSSTDAGGAPTGSTATGSTGSTDAPPADNSTPYYTASRLLPRSLFEHSPDGVTKAFTTMKLPGTTIIMHLVAGGAVSIFDPDSTALHPAWRKALLHVVGVGVSSSQPLFDLVSDDPAAYVNEGNTTEPIWKEIFWGSHYDRLKGIKDKVDPKGLFVCLACVGSEEWSFDGNCRV